MKLIEHDRTTASFGSAAARVALTLLLVHCGGTTNDGASASNSTGLEDVTSDSVTGPPHGTRADCDDGDGRELEESRAVPSARLITDFSVVRTSGESDVAALASLYKAPSSETDGPVLLRISNDDKITFSVGFHSVICRQDEDCRIAFAPGAPYTVVLERSSGERFQSQVTIPDETRITTPAPESFFDKAQSIDISWTPTSSTGNYGLTLSSFLGGLDCETQGWIDWYADTSARIPAGYLSQCPGSFRERFTVFYTNLARVPGVGGGTLKGYSTATLHFTYRDDHVRKAPAPAQVEQARLPIGRCDLRRLIGAAASGAKITELRER